MGSKAAIAHHRSLLTIFVQLLLAPAQFTCVLVCGYQPGPHSVHSHTVHLALAALLSP